MRKEAKRWLKALRAGDEDAAARFEAAWAGSATAAPAEPTLRDVQHALARDYGLLSWVALKSALEDLALAGKTAAERAEQLLRHGWDGDRTGARRILDRHPDVARFSLFTAAACGDLAEVERRLSSDPESAARAAKSTGGSLGWTALAYVTYGRLDAANAVAIARRLLEAGADPNFQFDDGWGCPFKVLTGAIGLGEGAKPTHPQALELVALLIEAGAAPYDLQALYNVSIVGEDTAWYDVLWDHAKAGGMLDHWRVPGEDRLGGSKGLSTLDYLLGNAVGQDHGARAEWLLARGANPGCSHFYTGQPLHALAQLSGFHAMAALLERHGATPAALSGVQAFQAACMRADDVAARALLVADPSLVADPGPLLAAAEHGNTAAVELLLSLGAPVGGVDKDGISPLHRAVQSGSLDAVRRLVEAGADVELRERRWQGTPMSWAVVLHQPHVAEYLAPRSRDVYAFVQEARMDRLAAVLAAEPELANPAPGGAKRPTPLFWLPDEEDAAVRVARVLLAHGADPAVRNQSSQTAADAARARGLLEAAELIEGDES